MIRTCTGLRAIADLLNNGHDAVVKAGATALRNLSTDPRNKTTLGECVCVCVCACVCYVQYICLRGCLEDQYEICESAKMSRKKYPAPLSTKIHFHIILWQNSQEL